MMHFSPWMGLGRELEPPELPLSVSKMEEAGYLVPDEIKAMTGYRELLRTLEGIAAQGLADLRRVNPITRGRPASEIDRDDVPA